ncbi:hypothetical protein Cgig2_024403 [Carnegiea gigantea]|uniref:Uncharacterized protein n=1 Tax=Carnegiea gigantea TaxID=171969 RepID=A0A9Q1JHD6_9CARY|nr:hypothetical protein Cgig2_024403 [Carnegiea gigantea]
MDAAKSLRRLRGHSSTANCCIASRNRPNVVATAGECSHLGMWGAQWEFSCKEIVSNVTPSTTTRTAGRWMDALAARCAFLGLKQEKKQVVKSARSTIGFLMLACAGFLTPGPRTRLCSWPRSPLSQLHCALASFHQDSCVCVFDLRCKDVQLVVKLGTDAISSLCFKQGNENMIYASSGSEIKCFDLQMPTFEKPMESYAYNKEEINQVDSSQS